MESEFVQVVDVTFFVNVAGMNGEPAALRYTVRPHLGDTMPQSEDGLVHIVFAPKEVMAGNEKVTLPGKKVSMAGILGMEREARLERRVRRPALSLVSKEKQDQADIAALAAKLLDE